MTTRWLFADQLGPHFLDGPDQPVLLIEARSVFARRPYHRQKAHLVLSAMRHLARDLGDQATLIRATTFTEALERVAGPLEVCAPTSRAARRLVHRHPRVAVLRERGFVTTSEDFAAWARARGSRRLLLEEFYRDARRRHGVLMDGEAPEGGAWNYDALNREPPPKAERLPVAPPWISGEDEIDEEVRRDLDRWEREGMRFMGSDGRRWSPATAAEAQAALAHFIEHRLPSFGRWEDAMLAADPAMAHSTLSPSLNLGLLDPMVCVRAAEAAYQDGSAPLAGVEGYVRQVMGWRDYVWHLYWHLGPDYRCRNALGATAPVPDWLWHLDVERVTAACMRGVLADLRERGWTHHIPRLMVLGSWALQHGVDPDELTDWFHAAFVDGYEWVMAPNVVGMSQYADGGLMATKPYTSGGAYINRMSDYCGGCAYDPKVRTGPAACPFTAGYWAFLAGKRDALAGNHRMSRALGGLDRLSDLDEVIAQERGRGTNPP